MIQGLLKKKMNIITVGAVGVLVAMGALFFSAHKKAVKEPLLKGAFSQEHTLSKKELQAENKKINKMLEW